MPNIVKICHPSSIYSPVVCGQTVYICLTQAWEALTVSGYSLVTGTVYSSTAVAPSASKCPPVNPCVPCDPCSPVDPCAPCDPCAESSNCPGRTYQYCLNIDLDQFLTDPGTGLPYTPNGCVDIVSIFPYECTLSSIIRIIEALYFEIEATGAGSIVQQVDNAELITFDTTDGLLAVSSAINTITHSVVIDPAPENDLTVSAAGLFVDADAALNFDILGTAPGSIVQTILDSETITFDAGDGLLALSSAVDTITYSVVIDPAPENDLTVSAAGLFVDADAALDFDILGTGAGSVAQTVNDSETITFDTSTGLTAVTSAVNTVTHSIVLSPDAGNDLEERGNGLFIDADAALNFDVLGTGAGSVAQTVNDSETITFDAGDGLIGVSSAVNTITYSPVIDPNPLNDLSVSAAGLFVDADATLNFDILGTGVGSISQTVNDSETITFDTGNGLDAVTSAVNTVTLTPVLDPAVTNLLSNSAAGLLSSFPTISSDNDCPNGGVGATYAIREAGISGTTLTLNGAPEHYSVSANTVGTTVVSAVWATLDSANGYQISLVVNNPSSCRTLEGLICAGSSISIEDDGGNPVPVIGHRLRVDGVIVAAQDGRTVAGWNMNWTFDTSAGIQDATISPIFHPISIVAGGSATILFEVGNNSVFSGSEPTDINLESRVVSFIGVPQLKMKQKITYYQFDGGYGKQEKNYLDSTPDEDIADDSAVAVITAEDFNSDVTNKVEIDKSAYDGKVAAGTQLLKDNRDAAIAAAVAAKAAEDAAKLAVINSLSTATSVSVDDLKKLVGLV